MSHAVSSSLLPAPAQAAAEIFRERFGGEPVLFRAPGRVNLIGEHTDYNDGFVMPAALAFATYVAIGPRNDRELHLFSTSFETLDTCSLDVIRPMPEHHWSDYVRGVAGVLLGRGIPLRGANLVIASDVPIGAGLSSSAAVEVATAFALLHNAGQSLDRKQIALVCQQAENEFTGARCGIMDQFISCFGQAGRGLLIDCRSLDSEPVPLPEDCQIVICNTRVRHALASGEYNKRRESCEEAVEYLKGSLPQIRALRDVSSAQLEQFGKGMPALAFRRARHVVGEDERVTHAAEASRSKNWARFGQLMVESHTSLRDDYEVSCKELDIMVSLALELEGVLGSRMTGGGFGGCTVNLVRQDAVADFQEKIAARYHAATGIAPQIYICEAAEGAGPISKEVSIG